MVFVDGECMVIICYTYKVNKHISNGKKTLFYYALGVRSRSEPVGAILGHTMCLYSSILILEVNQ